jgi:hypothetical protein
MDLDQLTHLEPNSPAVAVALAQHRFVVAVVGDALHRVEVPGSWGPREASDRNESMNV